MFLNIPGVNADAAKFLTKLGEAQSELRDGQFYVLTMLVASYVGGAPAGARISVQEDETFITLLELDIAAAGVFPVPIPDGGIRGNPNRGLNIRAIAGGAGIQGKLCGAYYVHA